MHLSTFQLNVLAKMFDLPDLLKQLNSSPFNIDSTLIENKQMALLPPTTTIQSGGSSPMASASPPTMLPNTINTPLIPPQLMNPALCAAYLQLLQQQQAQGQQNILNGLLQASMAAQFNNAQNTLFTNASSIFPPRFDTNTIPSVTIENATNPMMETRVSESEQSETRSVASTCSSANQPNNTSSSPFDNLGDVLVPSNDKEGWCRNKKYIQTVPNGYRCTVCNKVYGRYNSVSYHVTIYHRNPPIKCEEPGCQFTTREARYIYFHKYYRHGTPLPATIDTASRKCPFFSCRHVSKSPAMLEKHIQRHVAECSKNGSYSCPNCEFSTTQHNDMFQHLRIHQTQIDCGEKTGKRAAPGPSHNVFPCDQCTYKGRTLSNLEQHRVSKHHASPMNLRPIVTDENLKVNALPMQPALDAASLNLITLKTLFPENLFAMLSSAAVNAKP